MRVIGKMWQGLRWKIWKSPGTHNCKSRFLHEMDSWTEQLYNLGSGSWLAWANDVVAHYAAIHCQIKWTSTCGMQQADIPPPQSATLVLHPVTHKLLSWQNRGNCCLMVCVCTAWVSVNNRVCCRELTREIPVFGEFELPGQVISRLLAFVTDCVVTIHISRQYLASMFTSCPCTPNFSFRLEV